MNKEEKQEKLSFKELIKFYTKVRIPWIFIILTTLLSMLVTEAENWLVPYQTDIMTGEITGSGFLSSFVLFTLVYALVEAVQGSVNELGSAIATRNVSNKVWSKLINLPMSFFKGDQQSLVSRITQDTTGVYGAVTCLVQLWSVIYGLYTTFRRMYAVYDTLALIMLTAIPITLLMSWVIGKLNYKMIVIQNKSLADLTNYFGERLPNLFHIKTSNMEDEEYLKGVEANERRYQQEMKAERLFMASYPLSSVGMYINEIILLVVASALVRAGQMKMYQLVSLYNYALLFLGYASLLSGVWQGVKQSHGASILIAKIVEAEDEDLQTGKQVGKEAEDIRFENVSFSYDNDNQVLKDVSFTIPQGKKTVIVGENGSGKSTIVKLLESFEKPGSGQIKVGSDNLDDLNLTDWRNELGYLFQGEQLVKGSIAENIGYGCPHEYSLEEVEEVSKKAQAYDFIVEKEEGFETQISRFDAKVSGGQMQRIAIARALLKKPAYLIMDEAVSSIDMVNAREVMAAVEEEMDGSSLIVITHDIKMIEDGDHIIVLNQGVVEAEGTYDEVCANSALMQKFVNCEEGND